ncbi:hypothetical protein [Sulfurimonas sp.]|uniref:hypothetical protein n=1 Tax=Sulfurimonas sp. TaxID=2022749 RepID=UPI0025D56260|nr:hypothetical protein [Sulfurimonas sp.]MCK9472282.1 hypothetical protein [Sulfurimonas sp.]
MKSVHNALLKSLFILFLTTNYLNAANMCYEKPVTSGLGFCHGLLGFGCTTTTTIKNISNSTITDATIIHAFQGLEFDLLNQIGIDGDRKTTIKDSDEAEVSATLNDYLPLYGLIDLNLFNKGIVYRTGTYAKGATHSVYIKNLATINFSAEAYYATYKIGSTTYKEKLSLCADYTKNNPRDFTEIFQANINGNMKIIGNSILCKKSGSNCTEPDSDKNNNNLDTLFHKLGSDSSDNTIVNSTSYTFTLPNGVKKENILWAGLYWQAGIKGTASSADMDAVQTIKLKAPGDTSYKEITAETQNNRFNWIKNTTVNNAMYYQGVKEVTSIVRSAGAGTYQVANINNISSPDGEAYGNNYTPGHFGGWAMVIVYEDPSDTLKNITVYDGFDAVSSGKSVTANLSGFLTPSKGTVNSSFVIFGSEGDIGYKKDKISITNKSNTNYYLKGDGTASTSSGNYNPMGSSITQTGSDTRTPNYTNTIGIDIKTYNVGTGTDALGIISNSQTSTTITLSTGDDVYNPGVFAFSTQLYAPDVCYIEDLLFNGSKIGGSNIPAKGDEVEYEVTITNKDNEPAKSVLIEKRFNKPNEITYVGGSMQIAPIPGITYSAKTDTIGDDTAEYSTDTATAKFLLGIGATKDAGGTIDKGAETKFKYRAEVGDQNASENTYLVSYRNSQLYIDFTGLPIRKCVDFNNSFSVYVPVIGSYNTVRSGAVNIASGDKDPIDPLDGKNALYTQIVNKSFDVDVISFENDNITPKSWSGDLNLSIVELPDGVECESATELLSSKNELTFNKQKSYTLNITPTKASRSAVFKMVTDSTTVCSRDNFAIRPASYTMDVNDTTLIGNKFYTFSIKAAQNAQPNLASLGYTQSIHNTADKNATTQLIIPVGCTLATPIEFTNAAIPFNNGQVDALLRYSNVGEVEFTITDNNWAGLDYIDSKGDCIEYSSSNTPDANGRVGCMVKNSKRFIFIPNKFTNELSIVNSSAGFTYLSNDKNMSATLQLNTAARLYDAAGDDNLTATNYTKKCFAKDVNSTISLKNNKPLSWSDSQNRIKFYDDNNITSTKQNQVAAQAVFVSHEGNFTSGAAPLKFKFNFERNSTKVDNPFMIFRSDFEVVEITDGEVYGVGFDNLLDTNTTFIYGRTHASTQRYTVPNNTANIYFEAYCYGTGCAKNLLPNGLTSKQTDDTRWFINLNHNAPNDGNIGTVTQKNGTGTVTATAPNYAISWKPTTDLTYHGNSYPYKTTMHNNASSWLIYNKDVSSATTNEFQVEYDKVGGWSGAHETNTTTKGVGSTTTNRRLMW